MKLHTIIFTPSFIFLLTAIGLFSCHNEDPQVTKGRQLAAQYCQSCHLLPKPELLDAYTWKEHVLPKMGLNFGFEYIGYDMYRKGGNNVNTLLREDWDAIIKYYTFSAPEQLEEDPAERKKIVTGLKNFTVKIPATAVNTPTTTMVKIDEADKKIYYADGFSKKMYTYSTLAPAIDSISTGLGAVYLKKGDNLFYVLSMGVLHPTDEKLGDLSIIDAATKKNTIVLDSLQRPVNTAFADLNGDGKEDVVVCEFGDKTGNLSWFEKQKDGYIKHVLRPLPGAIKADVYDFNKDGLPDIIALMAQGDEGVFMYVNEGNGKFAEKRLLQFPPSYGSNYLELVDFNKDGFMDFITTNGDNGDYPPIMKPYHGIRIFLNDGKNNFTEKLFLPVQSSSA